MSLPDQTQTVRERLFCELWNRKPQATMQLLQETEDGTDERKVNIFCANYFILVFRMI